MAAVTPDTIYQASCGDNKLIIANFAGTVDSGDTWTTGIGGILSVMAMPTEVAGTQAATGGGASFVGSTGVITLILGEDNTAMTVWVLAKS